ncbi:MAG: hypothetical protein IKC19_05175 [Bacteroidales bacterium]|nr:hypothetical protein [Bacteroidales bacterium]
MRKVAPIILSLVLFCGGCCSYYKSIPNVNMECFSDGLIIFNQDGIYYFPKDSCCFIQEGDKEIDGLILVDRICTGRVRCYEHDDMEKLKAVKFYCKYATNVSRRTIPGVNDDNYFIKSDSCYMVFARIWMYSYREIDKRIESTYLWDVSIAGQKIRANILDGRNVFFDIERTESIDSIQLADFLMNKN